MARLPLLPVICLAAAAKVGDFPPPLTDLDFGRQSDAEIALSRLLFYDPVLSGNRNISCATCHHPRFATGDGVSLGAPHAS